MVNRTSQLVNHWIWVPGSFETHLENYAFLQVHHIEGNFEWFILDFGTNQPCHTPKTLRKVIPVKGWSKWANSVLDQAGQTLSENPLTKNGWMDHHAAELGNLLRIFFIWIWLQASTYYFVHVGCIFGKNAQIANVGRMRDVLQWIFQLHEAFFTTTLRQMKT